LPSCISTLELNLPQAQTGTAVVARFLFFDMDHPKAQGEREVRIGGIHDTHSKPRTECGQKTLIAANTNASNAQKICKTVKQLVFESGGHCLCVDLLWTVFTVASTIWTLSGHVEPGGCRHTYTSLPPSPFPQEAQHMQNTGLRWLLHEKAQFEGLEGPCVDPRYSHADDISMLNRGLFACLQPPSSPHQISDKQL
jgi:hypothetical protein